MNNKELLLQNSKKENPYIKFKIIPLILYSEAGGYGTVWVGYYINSSGSSDAPYIAGRVESSQEHLSLFETNINDIILKMFFIERDMDSYTQDPWGGNLAIYIDNLPEEYKNINMGIIFNNYDEWITTYSSHIGNYYNSPNLKDLEETNSGYQLYSYLNMNVDETKEMPEILLTFYP